MNALATADAPFRCKRRPGPFRCPCGCGAADGFCMDHRALLARVRVELESQTRRIQSDGGEHRGDGRERRGRGPRCCNPECDEPRPRGEQFCAECREGA